MKRVPMRAVLATLLAAAVSAEVFFKDDFSSMDGWVQSNWKKDEGGAGKIELSAGPWYKDAEADKGLKAVEDAKFYAVSKKFDKFSNAGKPLVLQFQVRFPQDIDCGGGYIKILGSEFDQENFQGDTPYAVMFGPDICGYSTKRVHAIFGYGGDNLLIKKTVACEDDVYSHVYTLVVDGDSYKILIDGDEKESGKIKEDWDFEQPKQIKDPEDTKPEDWVDDAEIDDPEDSKPEDWDQPEQIPDPEAEKPEDWDDEDDGEWEAALIPNPDYKGEWSPKKIANPEYKGEWVQKEIDNPDYVEVTDAGVYEDLGGVGIEVWQVKAGTIWDNIIITDSEEEAAEFRKATFDGAVDAEKEMKEAADKAAEEAEAEEADEDDAEDADDAADENEEDDFAELGDKDDL